MMQPVFATVEALMPSLVQLFDKTREDSRDGEGVTRDAFGPRETQAGETIIEFAKRHGLETSVDHGGNVHITPHGQMDDPPEVLLASHLDSVPVGGHYDGIAGVIAAVASLVALEKSGATEKSKVRVLAFRGEESPWFGHAYLGSKLVLGEMSRHELDTLRRFDTKKTLAEHIEGLGIKLPQGNLGPTIPLDNIKAYFELHIELAPFLESVDKPVGVSTAIRGNIRYPFAKCFGEYAHSGATLRQFRRDALTATSKLLAWADNRWKEMISDPKVDLVFTCGIIQTDSAEHSMTKVPGEIRFTPNIGGTQNDVMERFHNEMLKRAAELANEHQVRFDFGSRVGTPATDLDGSVVAVVEKAGLECGIETVRMPTVGHDAALFQRRGIPTSVILLRNANGGHNPKEHMEMTDFEIGTKVMARAAEKVCLE